MRRDDPLEMWLVTGAPGGALGSLDPKFAAHRQNQARQALDRLAQFLETSRPGKADMRNAFPWVWALGLSVALAPTDLQRAQDLYRRVCAAGGKGSAAVQEELLGLIAEAADPASIPFWREMLDLQRPRDKVASWRRVIALASLARLVIQRESAEAYAALREALRHANPEVRGLAIHDLGQACQIADRSLPEDILAELQEIAKQDEAFAPRFQARSVLRQMAQPIPLDNPGGVYLFKVKFMRAKHMSRTIALRSEQTLADLHFAIQNAIDWDADHLYSFFMNGQLWDWRYAFACPYEEGDPPWSDEAIIGELGLAREHKFLYYFDYGDSHQFEVEVVGIEAQAGRGKYPRVVESQGEAPAQYPSWD